MPGTISFGILSYNEIMDADINDLNVGVISSDFMIKSC